VRLSAGLTFDDLRRDMLAIMARVAPEVSQEPYLVRHRDLPGLPEPIETGAYAQKAFAHLRPKAKTQRASTSGRVSIASWMRSASATRARSDGRPSLPP